MSDDETENQIGLYKKQWFNLLVRCLDVDEGRVNDWIGEMLAPPNQYQVLLEKSGFWIVEFFLPREANCLKEEDRVSLQWEIIEIIDPGDNWGDFKIYDNVDDIVDVRKKICSALEKYGLRWKGGDLA